MKKIFCIMLILLFAVLFLFIFEDKSISPVGTALTEEQLFKDLKILGSDELKILYSDFLTNDKIKDEQGKVLNGRILQIVTKSFAFQEITKPLAVREAMRAWLYLTERTTPYPIVAINVYFRKGGTISPEKSTLISKDEFEELLQQVPVDVDNESKIDLLTDLYTRTDKYIPYPHR